MLLPYHMLLGMLGRVKPPGGDDAPRTIKTEKYKPRLKKDDFGNEIQPVISKLIVKKQYTIQDTKLLLDRLELQAEQDDEESFLMLL